MAEWHTEPLDECLDELLDYRGRSPPKSDQGIPVLSAKVVKSTGLLRPIEQKIAADYYSTWMVRGLPRVGDVVMTTEAPMGEVIQLDEETVQFALGQRIVCLRGKANKIDNTFLRYLLISPKQQDILAGYATGTTVLGISQKALRSVPISFPAFRDQQLIGQLLSSLDDKIDLNRRMNETLEAMARAIFKDWFIDFGPTRYKINGRPPYLSPVLWSLFPDHLDDNGKPEGWGRVRIGDLCKRVAMGPFGSDITADNFVEFGVPVIRGGNLKDGFVDDKFVYLTEEKADSLRNANAFPGAIVITHRGTLGQVGLIPLRSAHPRYVVSQSQMLIEVDEIAASPRFLFEFLRSPEGQHQLLADFVAELLERIGER